MVNETLVCGRFIRENEELKRALALSLNKPLVKRLKSALDRVNNGDYVSEEEFFRNQLTSHLYLLQLIVLSIYLYYLYVLLQEQEP